jgi:hypothetical protein
MSNKTAAVHIADVASVTDAGEVDIKITWTKWPNMERMIADENVKWEYHESVPLSEIDVKRSQDNFARLGRRIIPENVESIVIQARRYHALDLPALVGWRPDGPGTKIVLNDGNNRLVGVKKLGITRVAMYILTDPGPTQADTVTRRANAMVGVGHTLKEKLHHALAYYYSHPGCGYKDAAEKSSIQPGTLAQRVKADTLARRLSADGDIPVPGFEDFNDTVLVYLSRILNAIVLRHAATQLRTVRGFGYKEADRLQKVVKEADPSTEASQLEAVDAEIIKLRAEKALEKGPKRGPTSKQNALIRTVRQLLQQLEATFTPGVNPKDVFDIHHRAMYLELIRKVHTIQYKIEKGLS